MYIKNFLVTKKITTMKRVQNRALFIYDFLFKIRITECDIKQHIIKT